MMRADKTQSRAMALVACLVAVAAIGCGSARRGELVGPPVTPDNADERVGERLFYRHCSHCHPGGEAGLGPSLNDKPTPRLAIVAQIRNGVGAMPAFSAERLDDEAVEAIVAYLIDRRQTPATDPAGKP